MKKSCFKTLIIPAVSKVTLDIICETAFGYKADSLHNPYNELAVAYEKLIDLQSGTSLFDYHMNDTDAWIGPNLAKFILLMLIPGMPRFLASEWAYHHRRVFEKISLLRQYTSSDPLTFADSMKLHPLVSLSLTDLDH